MIILPCEVGLVQISLAIVVSTFKLQVRGSQAGEEAAIQREVNLCRQLGLTMAMHCAGSCKRLVTSDTSSGC